MDAAPSIPPRRLLDILNLRIQLQVLQQRHMVVQALLLRRQQRQGRSKRRWWVKPWIERRILFGQYETLMREIERECQGDFLNYLRMPPVMFYELLQRITPRIQKSERYRRPLEPGLKLAINYHQVYSDRKQL